MALGHQSCSSLSGGDEPGSVVEEELCGDQGKGEGDDEGGEEEGLKETGDHCRPAKRRRRCKQPSTLLDLELGSW